MLCVSKLPPILLASPRNFIYPLEKLRHCDYVEFDQNTKFKHGSNSKATEIQHKTNDLII